MKNSFFTLLITFLLLTPLANASEYHKEGMKLYQAHYEQQHGKRLKP